jgi:glycosyltransferase involved in cell wall biosynthesis
MPPKLSIVTVCFNNKEGLDKTIRSIISQTFHDYEFIIIDGGSSDGSADVIKKYEDKISYWISEKDNGAYYAMNKGIAKANGEYCLFLNSGDYLNSDDILQKVFKNNYEQDIIYGNMKIDWGQGKVTIGTMPDKISFYQMYTDTLWHPVSFIKRTLFEKYGKYNEMYKIVADYDFFFKTIVMNNVSTRHLSVIVSVFNNTKGLSSRPENNVLLQSERQQVLKSYLAPAIIELAEEYKKKNISIKKRFWFLRKN